MPPIHFIGGEQGGGGKSLVARILKMWLKNAYSAIDALHV